MPDICCWVSFGGIGGDFISTGCIVCFLDTTGCTTTRPGGAVSDLGAITLGVLFGSSSSKIPATEERVDREEAFESPTT